MGLTPLSDANQTGIRKGGAEPNGGQEGWGSLRCLTLTKRGSGRVGLNQMGVRKGGARSAV